MSKNRLLPCKTVTIYLKKKDKKVTLGSCFINHNYSLFSIFRFGDVSLQESINQENFELLKEYYTVFMEKMPPDCKYASYQKKKKKPTTIIISWLIILWERTDIKVNGRKKHGVGMWEWFWNCLRQRDWLPRWPRRHLPRCSDCIQVCPAAHIRTLISVPWESARS